MFNKVIVGVDGLQGGRDALEYAARLAPASALVLATVYPYDDVPSRFAMLGYGNALREDTEKALRQARRDAGLEEAHLAVIPSTSASRALHDLAVHEHADLLVLGSPHRGAVGRVLIGDVARSVLHGSPCPVAVVPHGFAERAPKIVGVAFDGSPEAKAALAFAAGLARRTGGRVEALNVVEPLAFALPMGGYAFDPVEVYDEVRDDAQKELDELLAGLDVPASGRALVDRPHERLSAFAKDVDVLVTGSRGWGAFQRVALGSMADRLIHDAPCTVIVVPRGAATAATNGREAAVTATAQT